MAIDLTLEQLVAALKLGSSAAETAEATRLLAYVHVAIPREAPDAPAVVSNEAGIRLAAYLYDQPTASVGDQVANALRSSGAKAILLPFRVHRAGHLDGGTQAAAAPETSLLPSSPQVPSPGNDVKVAYGWSTDLSFVPLEITAKSASHTFVIPPLPVGESSAWAGLWTSDREGIPMAFSIPGALADQLGAYGSGAAFTLDSIPGTLRISNSRLGPSDVGKTSMVSF